MCLLSAFHGQVPGPLNAFALYNCFFQVLFTQQGKLLKDKRSWQP